ncbi:Predicted amidophosphoribosyltransferases [Pedococcus dokdonensis]|uniref:Predicted amidophosphoribosyltransferases n=1 Tax=Pedococcus dokdonensis TaxID=443156 RepID=A0A1H0R7Y8_9MICO|nr:Predicted amidophosphoribosyltransferases [Pedococcus dokdonensis]
MRPRPCPPGLPTVHSAGRYAEALAAVVSAYKDDGRRQHAGVLGALLAESVDAAVGASPELLAVLAGANGPVLVVPVPSSAAARRRRGDAPLVAVARVAVGGYAAAELVVAEALAPRRRVADQAGLAARERAVNLEHSMTVTTRWEPVVRGAACVVVDDVLTTGATLVEAARALGAAGARVVVAATVCATQRRADAARHPRSGQPPPASGAVPAGRAARSGPAQQTRGKR